jgi:hypothetical protein
VRVCDLISRRHRKAAVTSLTLTHFPNIPLDRRYRALVNPFPIKFGVRPGARDHIARARSDRTYSPPPYRPDLVILPPLSCSCPRHPAMEDSSDSNAEDGALPANEYASNTTKRQVYLEFSQFSPSQLKKIEDLFDQYVNNRNNNNAITRYRFVVISIQGRTDSGFNDFICHTFSPGPPHTL